MALFSSRGIYFPLIIIIITAAALSLIFLFRSEIKCQGKPPIACGEGKKQVVVGLFGFETFSGNLFFQMDKISWLVVNTSMTRDPTTVLFHHYEKNETFPVDAIIVNLERTDLEPLAWVPSFISLTRFHSSVPIIAFSSLPPSLSPLLLFVLHSPPLSKLFHSSFLYHPFAFISFYPILMFIY